MVGIAGNPIPTIPDDFNPKICAYFAVVRDRAGAIAEICQMIKESAARKADLPDMLYTLPEVARMTRQGLTKIYEDMAGGRLRTVKNGRSRRATPEAVREYIAQMARAS